MQKLIELKKDENILVSSKLESFLKPDYVYDNLLNADMLIIRASLEKSKTTRMFDVSKFRNIIKK